MMCLVLAMRPATARVEKQITTATAILSFPWLSEIQMKGEKLKHYFGPFNTIHIERRAFSLVGALVLSKRVRIIFF